MNFNFKNDNESIDLVIDKRFKLHITRSEGNYAFDIYDLDDEHIVDLGWVSNDDLEDSDYEELV